MADIAGLLKAEIVRLSRKTVRQTLAPLLASTRTQRHEIRSLKRQVAALEESVARLHQHLAATRPAAATIEPQSAPRRFVAKGLKSLRARLDVSQSEFAKLVGVSAQSVYNWERGSARPRPAQLAAIAALRQLGKREARRRLDEMA
ncbi:helix-turn-helix transcriptional regulator [Fontimonas sp. SYSU GA230001]|uniref:helix-turn-helix domain-containing protein n=1 Tax=Fontimonas sp. SYSU GA230001 TaxID=3142450 RepID=UPI0032B5D661